MELPIHNRKCEENVKASITPDSPIRVSLAQFYSILITIVASTIWLTWNIQAGLSSLNEQKEKIARIEDTIWTVQEMGELYSSVDLWLNNTNRSRSERRAVVSELHNALNH